MSINSLVTDGPGAGADNMRRDSDLLRRCAAGETTGAIRLYWFAPPCVSLGRLEPMSDIDLFACARDGITIVRRPSGGRAVLHDDEVTYAVVCRADDPYFGGDVMTSCSRIHQAVALGLTALGVAATPHASAPQERRAARTALSLADCFARPAAHELLDEHGGKLVGSAQARRGSALLQHGSVLLSPSRAERYLRSSSGANGGIAAHGRSASSGLRALAGRDLTREEVASALAGGFRRTMCAEALDTTA
jgi:lipoate-protein ligase A